jgi:hypothetical protein
VLLANGAVPFDTNFLPFFFPFCRILSLKAGANGAELLGQDEWMGGGLLAAAS